jgi:hypothetical protein
MSFEYLNSNEADGVGALRPYPVAIFHNNLKDWVE